MGLRRCAALAIATCCGACASFFGVESEDPQPPPASGADAASDAGPVRQEAGADAGAESGEAPDGASDAPNDVAKEAAPVGCSFGVAACARRVFTTHATYHGDLGGLSGADDKCQSAADDSGNPALVGRKFAAWMSISEAGSEAKDRLTHGTLAYDHTRDSAVANDWSGFASSTHLQPMRYDENGNDVGDDFVWTGTDALGFAVTDDCNGWADGTNAHSGVVGASSIVTGMGWSDVTSTTCDQVAHLYCVER